MIAPSRFLALSYWSASKENLVAASTGPSLS
jgi:hypothetical protein